MINFIAQANIKHACTGTICIGELKQILEAELQGTGVGEVLDDEQLQELINKGDTDNDGNLSIRGRLYVSRNVLVHIVAIRSL